MFSGRKPTAPPTSLTFKSATDTSITFSFTAPSGIIYSYIPYINGAKTTGQGVPTNYTITGLTASTSYSVTLSAANPSGQSSQSTAVTMYTAISSSGLVFRFTGDVGTNSGSSVYNQLYTGNVLSGTLNNSASVGNATYKQGTGSMYFPTQNSSSTTGSNIKINSPTFKTPSTGYISVAFWAYPIIIVPWMCFFSFFDSGGKDNIQLYISNSSTKFSMGITTNDYDITTAPIVALNAWTHIVVMYPLTSSNNCYIYVNNTKYSQLINYTGGSISGSLANVTFINHNIGIDGYWPNPNFKGYIDEFRLYNRQLTDAEVSSLYLLRG